MNKSYELEFNYKTYLLNYVLVSHYIDQSSRNDQKNR